ncbi:hypothetical protein DMB38_12860 [Streptomyces sp. WAC 06738]|uniref:hypothetical protein n=1 Tax=Streptomyces sp. WAC 06738 TaxID=2203210 RepID=UPI000F6FAC0D|nr:hypothetical protein [Streptomyces sp. WAC 06738]AZM46585.1 hypothetical protein DMB38_12860 [Streptomyces sp. WAC 06738]
MIPASLTVGGLGVGLAILGVNLWKWWKSPGRDPKALLPFAAGLSLGALATLCAGGLLGVLAGWTAGLNNKAGEVAVPGATGTSSGAVARGSMGALTSGGALLVFLLAVAYVVAWRAANKELKRKLLGGWWSGATLSLSAGAAGILASTLVPLVNDAGGEVLAFFEGGGFL